MLNSFERFAFFGSLIVGIQLVTRDNDILPIVLKIVSLTANILILIQTTSIPGMPELWNETAFFGNANVYADFLGYGFIATLLLAKSTSHPALRLGLMFSLFFQLHSIQVLNARSVALGLLLIVMILCLYHARKAWFVFVSLGVMGGVSFLLFTEDLKPIMDSVALNYQSPDRLDIWKSTLRAIADHPLGIGLDQFKDAIIPYRSYIGDISRVFHSPHNEYLRLALELGLPAFLLLLILVAKLALKTLKARAAFRQMDFDFVLTFGFFFLFQAVFQFPLSWPHSCFFFCLVLAKCLVVVFPVRNLKHSLPATSLVLAFANVIAVLMVVAGLSRWVEVQSQSPRILATVCRMVPSYLPVCLKKAKVELEAARYVAATETLEFILQTHPHHIATRKALALASVELQKHDKACTLATEILRNANDSDMKEVKARYCAKIP